MLYHLLVVRGRVCDHTPIRGHAITTKIHTVAFTSSLLIATAVAPACAVDMTQERARSIRDASHRTGFSITQLPRPSLLAAQRSRLPRYRSRHSRLPRFMSRGGQSRQRRVRGQGNWRSDGCDKDTSVVILQNEIVALWNARHHLLKRANISPR